MTAEIAGQWAWSPAISLKIICGWRWVAASPACREVPLQRGELAKSRAADKLRSDIADGERRREWISEVTVADSRSEGLAARLARTRMPFSKMAYRAELTYAGGGFSPFRRRSFGIRPSVRYRRLRAPATIY